MPLACPFESDHMRQIKSPTTWRAILFGGESGFEPTVTLLPRQFSRLLPSTTRSSLRNRGDYTSKSNVTPALGLGEDECRNALGANRLERFGSGVEGSTSSDNIVDQYNVAAINLVGSQWHECSMELGETPHSSGRVLFGLAKAHKERLVLSSGLAAKLSGNYRRLVVPTAPNVARAGWDVRHERASWYGQATCHDRGYISASGLGTAKLELPDKLLWNIFVPRGRLHAMQTATPTARHAGSAADGQRMTTEAAIGCQRGTSPAGRAPQRALSPATKTDVGSYN